MKTRVRIPLGPLKIKPCKSIYLQGFIVIAGWNGKHIISSDGGTTGISQGAAETDGNWHHIAMTWQKNTVNGFRSFLDGQLVEQRNSANVNLPPFSSSYVPVLGSFDGTQEYLSGTLDNVRIWNRALSQQEIQFRMNCEIPTSATGLIANYLSIKVLQIPIMHRSLHWMMSPEFLISGCWFNLHLTEIHPTG